MSILSILNYVVYKKGLMNKSLVGNGSGLKCIQSYFSERSSIKDKKIIKKQLGRGEIWPRKDNCSGSNLRGCRMDWLDGAKKNVNG